MRRLTALAAMVAVVLCASTVLAANPDRPNGFAPFDPTAHGPLLVAYPCASGQTFVKGDIVKCAAAGCSIITAGTDVEISGVAAEACTSGTPATGDTVDIYPAESWRFRAQCSGTYAAASYLYTLVAVEGTTSIMEVDENGSAGKIFFVEGLVDSPENAAGANAEVFGRFSRSMTGWRDLAKEDLATDIVRTSYGLVMDQTNGLYIDLDATDGGLQFDTGKLSVLLEANEGLTTSASGLAVDYDASNIAMNASNKLDIKERCITSSFLGADADKKRPFVTPWGGTVQTTAYIVSDTATAGSGATTKWDFDIVDKDGNDMTATDWDTNGSELAALTPQALTLDQNLTVTAGEGLYVNLDETDGGGAPTDLSAAWMSVTICIDTF